MSDRPIADEPGDRPRAPEPVREEARALFGLAWPLAVSLTGNAALGFVITALVGRVDPTELAGVAIGNGIFFTATISAAGVVFGIDPLLAQALGAREGARARAILRSGLKLSLALALAAIAVVLVSPCALPLAGVDAATTDAARRFLWARAPGVLPLVVVITLRSYLQARLVTRPIVLSMVAANLVNALLAVPLVLGDRGLAMAGLPALGLSGHGALGAGLATSGATFAQLAVMALGFRALEPADGEGDTTVPLGSLLRLGLPLGLTLLAEIGAFTVAGVMAGRMGPLAASGHQVALSLASMSFTASMAIGDATSVRVGMAVGRGDTPGARRAGFVGLGLATAWMSLTAAVFAFGGEAVARLVSDRPEVIASAAPLLLVAAAFQLFDGAQVVGAGALRGLGDTRPAQWANLVGYYAVGLPLAWFLGFRAGHGTAGLWWGLCVGLAIVAVALVLRFERRTRTAVGRVR
ncbi:MAG: MATE family efflux transporter [Deltaproteobacteria bacterium]|nr:MATE family efflux transporter [Deltaproteobacteria bacterium]